MTRDGKQPIRSIILTCKHYYLQQQSGLGTRFPFFRPAKLLLHLLSFYREEESTSRLTETSRRKLTLVFFRAKVPFVILNTMATCSTLPTLLKNCTIAAAGAVPNDSWAAWRESLHFSYHFSRCGWESGQERESLHMPSQTGERRGCSKTSPKLPSSLGCRQQSPALLHAASWTSVLKNAKSGRPCWHGPSLIQFNKVQQPAAPVSNTKPTTGREGGVERGQTQYGGGGEKEALLMSGTMTTCLGYAKLLPTLAYFLLWRDLNCDNRALLKKEKKMWDYKIENPNIAR